MCSHVSVEKNRSPYLIDIPVFLTFFVRYDTLKKVFARIKEVKPRVLFLVADGPRNDHPEDYELSKKCKKIVEDVDWDCEVHRYYASDNLGIIDNTCFGLKRAFEHVDRLIFLEDDVLPDISFFYFCKELLEKYIDDKRIHMICGMNHLGNYSEPSADYFFSRIGSIWGFALWKRTFDDFENILDVVNDPYSSFLAVKNAPTWGSMRAFQKGFIDVKLYGRPNSIPSFELVSGLTSVLNSSLVIVPSCNLIHSLGISENSGHSVDHSWKLPKSIRRMFSMQTYTLRFPLVHPKYVVCDVLYDEMVRTILGKNKSVVLLRKISTRVRIAIVSCLLYLKILKRQ